MGRRTHVVAVPCDHVKGAVVLLADEELAAQLVDNLPWVVFRHLVMRYRAEEVSCVGKSISTQRTQLGKLKVGAPDLENVATGWSLDIDLESLPALDDADLARLDVELAELGLDVQCTFLSDD